MHRICWLAALAAGALPGAVIRGVVVDASTGRPLARSLVALQPVEGTPGQAASSRTGSAGSFVFEQLPAGAYLLSASRYGFAPFQYGQKYWRGTGTAIVIEAGGSAFLDIRLRRFGAIAGTVWDENEVGIPEHEVAAYRATRPPKLAARAKTDDRGMFRIFGLEPGTYFVRTLARQIDEVGMLPTFAKETARVDEARLYEVELDQQVGDVTVKPIPGRIFTISGRAYVYPAAPTTLTLVSDMGTQQTSADGAGNFTFEHVPPGPYELEARAYDSFRRQPMFAWEPLSVDRDRSDLRVALRYSPEVEIRFENDKGERIDPRSVAAMARRKDLSGSGHPSVLNVQRDRVSLAPGRWELSLVPSGAWYAVRFSGPDSDPARRADGWNEIRLHFGHGAIRFTLSSRPGSVNGRVAGMGRDPVPGAPVYLEAYDLERQLRLTDLRTTRSDIRGQYRFEGLPPGRYRILATFDYEDPEPSVMEAAGARLIEVTEGRDTAHDPDLYSR